MMTASEMGRKGGRIRSERMTPAQRKAAATKAVKARWAKAKKKK